MALTRVSDKVFAVLEQPGLYSVEGGGARDTFAVNVADPQLLEPDPHQRLRLDPRPPRRRQFRLGLVGLLRHRAFALAVAEWWTWQRRITV